MTPEQLAARDAARERFFNEVDRLFGLQVRRITAEGAKRATKKSENIKNDTVSLPSSLSPPCP